MQKNNPYAKFLSKEQVDHSQLCTWLQWQHPHLLWWHTPNEGRKTPFEQYLSKKMGVKKGVSDFVIICGNNKYNGLVIELKAPGVKVYKKDGSCYFPEQQEFIHKCKQSRFYGQFCVGFEDAKETITKYLNNQI